MSSVLGKVLGQNLTQLCVESGKFLSLEKLLGKFLLLLCVLWVSLGVPVQKWAILM